MASWTDGTAPQLTITYDDAGFPIIRVLDIQTPVESPDTVLRDRTVDSMSYGVRVVGNGVSDLLIDNLTVTDSKNGIALLNTGTTSIFDLEFDNFVLDGSLFGAAIRVGSKTAEYTSKGVTYVQDVEADGHMAPLGVYGTGPNTDFLVVEKGCAPVMLRDVTASNFSDAIIDCKSTVYIMNATLEGAHRILRAHEGATIVIVNSILETGADGQALAWLKDSTSKIYFYNTLWNGKSAPGLEDVRGDGSFTPELALKNIIQLKENPLPAIDPFFATDFDRVKIEILDGAGKWVDSGFNGTVGDLSFELADLGIKSGKARVSYTLGGATVGNPYVVDLATGEIVESERLAASGLTDSTVTDDPAADTTGGSDTGAGDTSAPPGPDGTNPPSGEIIGSDGNDTISGTSLADRIFGGGGEDFLRAHHGEDLIEGGAGHDTLAGGTGNDAASGGDGNDLLRMGDGEDTALGGEGMDTLVGAAGNDSLGGDAGADDISGDAGDDALYGGDGNDVLKGGRGNDSLQGGNGDDILRGATDDDLLQGNAGNDSLFGEDGNDTLVGGAGNDSLVGGDGNDVFIVTPGEGVQASDSISGGLGIDTVEIWLRMGTGQGLTTSLQQLEASAKAAIAASVAGGTFKLDLGGDQFTLRGIEAIEFHNLDEDGRAYAFAAGDVMA